MFASSQTGLRNGGIPKEHKSLLMKGKGNLESKKGSPQPSKPSRGDSPSVAQTKSNGLPLIRDSVGNYGLSLSAKDVLTASWRTGTTKQYETSLTKWLSYCNENAVDVFRPSTNQGVEILVTLFRFGLRYSAANTALSALSSIVNLSDGSKFGEVAA